MGQACRQARAQAYKDVEGGSLVKESTYASVAATEHGVSLRGIAEFYVDALCQKENLKENLQRSSEVEAFRVGTLCSGSDVVIAALQHTLSAMKHRFGQAPHVDHVFSVENNPKKLKWIQCHQQPTFLFNELSNFAKGPTPVTINGDSVPTESLKVDLLICGFSCKTLSGENTAKSGTCISTGTGSTGETWTWTSDVIKTMKPKVVLMENVIGLVQRSWDDSKEIWNEAGINTIAKEMEQMGYDFKHINLDTQKYGIPQRRNRCWMIGMRSSEEQPPHKHKHMHCRICRGKNMPVPILEQIMAGSACIAHFRSLSGQQQAHHRCRPGQKS